MNAYFNQRRVLVTGGTGFAGSHLVEALLSAGARVVVLSRSEDPYGYFFTQGLQHRSIIVDGDVKSSTRIFDVVSRYEISHIFHLAAQPLVTTALINPHETLETNIMGTVNVLEAARKSPFVQGVVLASSDKAYGKLDRPYVEEDPLRGDHPYEVSKSAADLIAQTYAQTYNLPVVISRFGNIYGEGDLNPSRVIPGILLSVLKQEPFYIRSNGLYKRAYIHVNDVVAGYLELAQHIQEYAGQAFNFGSSEIYSVLDLITVFEETLGIQIDYQIQNTAVNEIPSQSVSYEKALTLLGWSPKLSVLGAIPSLYMWYKQFIERTEGQSYVLPSTAQVGTQPRTGSTIFSIT